MTAERAITLATAAACILAAQALACCAFVGGSVYGVLSALAIAAGAVLLDPGPIESR